MGKFNQPTDVFKHINMSPVSPSTCWLWNASVNDKGLPYFQYNKRKYIAYRLVYWLTHPEFDIENTRIVIRHKCTDENGAHVDNPLCCNPAHMEHGTHKDNMNDMMLRGRKGHTMEVIKEILEITQRAPGLTHHQIAKLAGEKYSTRVSRQTVTDVLRGYRRKVLRDAIDKRFVDEEKSGNENT